MSRVAADLPDHLHPDALRLGFVVDAESVTRLLADEHSMPRLRRAVIEILASERIDRDGVGRVVVAS